MQLQRELQAAGVRLLFCHQVTSAEQTAAARAAAGEGAARRGLALSLERRDVDGGWAPSPETLRVDMLMTATGRRAATGGVNLSAAGVRYAPNGDVETDAALRSSVQRVFAAGDVVGAPQLASTGIAQAEAAINAMFGANGEEGGGELNFGHMAKVGVRHLGRD